MNRHPRRLSGKARKEQRTAYLCLIPAFVGLIVLTYVPLLAVFIISFFQWKGISSPHFNGISDYIRLFTSDPYFKDSIVATVYFSVLAVAGSMVYSLVVAILLNRKIPARGFWRAVFYLPYVLPAAAVYIGWSWLYETNFGLFNFILKGLGIQNVMFLTDADYVVPSLALIAVWLSGNLIVIFLAGLQNVPRVYHEAATIDGAGPMRILVSIILPAIKAAMIIVALFLFITLWNDLLQQTIYIDDPNKFTIAIGLSVFRSGLKADWAKIMCATCLAFIPGVVIYLLGQRYFVEGIVMTGMKN